MGLPKCGVFPLQVTEQSGGYLVQKQSGAGGVGQNGHGLVDGVASQKHVDCRAVLPQDGLTESGVEGGSRPFFQGLCTAGDQLPAASLGYVAHEQNLRVGTWKFRGHTGQNRSISVSL